MLHPWLPSARFRTLLMLALLACGSAGALPAATVGSWSPLATPAPAAISTMLLMTDGSVLAQATQSTAWYRLTPDPHGSYRHGLWSTVTPMHESRLYYASVLLCDGRLLVGGGEYGTGMKTMEIFDPQQCSWNLLTSWNTGFGATVAIDDSTAKLLPDGRVLLLPYLSSGGYLYDPSTDTWTATSPKLAEGSNDEESVVQLPNGDFLLTDIWDAPPHGSQRYRPSTDTWIPSGTVPVDLVDSGSELGPATLLDDGRVLCLGATGSTAIYTPPATAAETTSGSWSAGPLLPICPATSAPFSCDDAPCAVLPNGRVLLLADAGTYLPPTAAFEFDPTSLTFLPVTLPASISTGSAFTNRLLVLPSGEVLLSAGTGEVDVYTPGDAPIDAWRPTIASISTNQDGTVTLTGTQFNGLNEGASYGDDAQMSSNYPVVRLTDPSGVVSFAAAVHVSTMGVATQAVPVAATFVPLRQPNGEYTVSVIANGVASAEMPFSLSRPTSAPRFTSVGLTGASSSMLYAYQAIATGVPAPTFALSIHPSGMSIDPTTGTILWHPSGHGEIPVTVTASNGISPDASQSFLIAVDDPPIISSQPITTAIAGQSYTYTVTVSNPPAPTFSLSTSPAGMSIDSVAGSITWTPTAGGTFPVTVTVANGIAPATTQTFVILVDAAPSFTTLPPTTGSLQTAYAWTSTASGTPPPTFSLSTAPPGMTINRVSGQIAWTPTTGGPVAVTMLASNGISPDAKLTFQIIVAGPPVITSTPQRLAYVGGTYGATITATGYPTPTFALTVAPGGMTIDAVSGALTWTPGTTGTFPVVLTADNGVMPDATQSFLVTVSTTATEPISPPPASSGSGHGCGLGDGGMGLAMTLWWAWRVRRRHPAHPHLSARLPSTRSSPHDRVK